MFLPTQDFNRHALISANEMRHIGENGVAMRGSTDWVDGRGGNQPRFNEISGNMIHHLGLYTKQSCAIFSAVSCQNTISENIMFHGPRALVNMNDGVSHLHLHCNPVVRVGLPATRTAKIARHMLPSSC